MSKIFEALEKGQEILAKSGNKNSFFEAEWIMQSVLECEKIELLQTKIGPLKNHLQQKFFELIEARSTGRPLAYLLKSTEFYGLKFYIDEGVLIPRPETELMVELAHKEMPKVQPSIVFDLGAGSGCIGLTLAKVCPELKVVLVEKSEFALKVIEQNRKNMELMKNTRVILADVTKLMDDEIQREFSESVDYVLTNPPYIASSSRDVASDVLQHEPHLALFSGEVGDEHVKEWSQVAWTLLKRGGKLFCEIGYDQGSATNQFLKETKKWMNVRIVKDYNGHDRIVIATKG